MCKSRDRGARPAIGAGGNRREQPALAQRMGPGEERGALSRSRSSRIRSPLRPSTATQGRSCNPMWTRSVVTTSRTTRRTDGIGHPASASVNRVQNPRKRATACVFAPRREGPPAFPRHLAAKGAWPAARSRSQRRECGGRAVATRTSRRVAQGLKRGWSADLKRRIGPDENASGVAVTSRHALHQSAPPPSTALLVARTFRI
jgi:hypothetical protein